MYQSIQDDYKTSSNLRPFDPNQRRMIKPKSESRLANDLSINSKQDNVFDRLTKLDAGMEKYKSILKSAEKGNNELSKTSKNPIPEEIYGNSALVNQKKMKMLKKKPAREGKNSKGLPNIRKRYGKPRNEDDTNKKMSMINIESKGGIIDDDKKNNASPYDAIKNKNHKGNKDDQNSSYLELPESDTKYGQRDENSYSSDEDFEEFDILKLPNSNR